MLEHINVGCGTVPLPGYVNLDMEEGAGRVQCDVREGLPWEDGAVAEVRADQFLEHLTLAEIEAFLGECERVLCPGGEIRLSFPDVVAIAGMAERGQLEGVAAQEGVAGGLGVLNHMGHGWGHRVVLTTELVRQRVAARFEVLWAATCGTNGLVVARKGA